MNNKKRIINRLYNVLKGQIEIIETDKFLSNKGKREQLSVVYELFKTLKELNKEEEKDSER